MCNHDVIIEEPSTHTGSIFIRVVQMAAVISDFFCQGMGLMNLGVSCETNPASLSASLRNKVSLFYVNFMHIERLGTASFFRGMKAAAGKSLWA